MGRGKGREGESRRRTGGEERGEREKEEGREPFSTAILLI